MPTRLYFKPTLYNRSFYSGTYNQGFPVRAVFAGDYNTAQDRHIVAGRFDDLTTSPGALEYSGIGNDIDWTQATIGESTPFPSVDMTTVHYSTVANLWLAGDRVGKIYSSPDGEQWTLRYTDPSGRFLERFKSAEGFIVCVGDQGGVGVPGIILYSTDGINWTQAAQTVVENILSIDYSPSQDLWVAVGSAGNIWTTNNPAGTWVNTSSGPSSRYSVNWNPVLNLWISSGSSGLLQTSTNGTTWTARTSGVTASLWTVTTLTNGTSFVVGSGGVVLRSTDGTTWTNLSAGATPPPDTVNIYYTAWQGKTNELYIAGTTGFLIKTTDSGSTWQVLGSEQSAIISTLSTSNLFQGDSSNLRYMEETPNTAAAQSTIVNTSAPLNTQQTAFLAMFASRPLDVAQTVGGGSIILNTSQNGSAAAAQYRVTSMNVYVWRPSTATIVGYVRDAAATLLGGAAGGTGQTVQHITGITSTGVSAQAGDVIICEIWATWTQSMGTSYTVTYYYGGNTINTTQGAAVTNHAGFIEFNENLTFVPPPSTGPTKGRGRGFLHFF